MLERRWRRRRLAGLDEASKRLRARRRFGACGRRRLARVTGPRALGAARHGAAGSRARGQGIGRRASRQANILCDSAPSTPASSPFLTCFYFLPAPETVCAVGGQSGKCPDLSHRSQPWAKRERKKKNHQGQTQQQQTESATLPRSPRLAIDHSTDGKKHSLLPQPVSPAPLISPPARRRRPKLQGQAGCLLPPASSLPTQPPSICFILAPPIQRQALLHRPPLSSPAPRPTANKRGQLSDAGTIAPARRSHLVPIPTATPACFLEMASCPPSWR